MKFVIDTAKQEVRIEGDEKGKTLSLYSREAFELLSELWVKVGWNQKYIYTFTWLGRPIIQLPEDMFRIQEVLYRIKPDVIIETGIAHGGSLVFYAGICKVMGKGRIIGVDIEIREHNRRAMEAHELFPYLTLVEGDSTDEATVRLVKAMVKKGETVLVILDSDHSKPHVLKELEAYHGLVSPGSYIVATDGIIEDLKDVPRGYDYWKKGSPVAAVQEFLKKHPDFALERPEWLFNESQLTREVTHWPGAWLKRRSA